MSFAEQERALFDLLFDQPLRDDFCLRSTLALSDYQLSDGEREDFSQIRPDGLTMDASLRADQVLVHLCRQFPLTFSLLSCQPGGMGLLRQRVNGQTMRQAPEDRATQFGAQLQEILAKPAHHGAMLGATLAAELGLAWTSANLRKQLRQDNALTLPPPAPSLYLDTDSWLDRPITLGAQVAASLLPHSYSANKKALCPGDDASLWAHLSQRPTTEAQIQNALGQPAPVLFISRATVSNHGVCETRIDHVTLELNDGFAPLLQQIDGEKSVTQIIKQLIDIGASPKIITGVKNGFKQLLESSIIEFV